MANNDFERFIKEGTSRTFFLAKSENTYKCAYFLFQENRKLELIIPLMLSLSPNRPEPFFPFLPIEEMPDVQAEELTLVNKCQLIALTEMVSELPGRPKKTYGLFLSEMSKGEVSGSLDALSTNLSIVFDSIDIENLYQILLKVANVLGIIKGGKLNFVTNIGCEL
jgi:hypothetical protein